MFSSARAAARFLKMFDPSTQPGRLALERLTFLEVQAFRQECAASWLSRKLLQMGSLRELLTFVPALLAAIPVAYLFGALQPGAQVVYMAATLVFFFAFLQLGDFLEGPARAQLRLNSVERGAPSPQEPSLCSPPQGVAG